MKLCVVGTGLIGSSFALGLKHRSSDADLVVLGVDNNRENAATALELGIIDRIVSQEEGLAQADVTVLAIPVDHIVGIINHCLDVLPERAVLLDMGSTKLAIANAVQNHPRRGRYVAAHPIAGREKAGPAAARHELMFHKPMLICDRERSDPDALQRAVDLFGTLEMRVTYTTAAQHDRRLSYTSHLPHLLAFALSNTILDEEENTEMLDSAGGGLKSVVRLALHSAQMWTPIFAQNRNHLMEANGRLMHQLAALQEALEANDTEAINTLITQANSIEALLRN